MNSAEQYRPSLAGIEKRAAEATDGPWFLDADGDSGVYTEPRPSPTSRDVASAYESTDEALIAHARTDLDALTAAVRDVLAILDEREAEMGDLMLPDLRALIRDVRRALAAHLDLTDPEGDPT